MVETDQDGLIGKASKYVAGISQLIDVPGNSHIAEPFAICLFAVQVMPAQHSK
jgi:hypothetical protein